jgi:hypothetical protein
VWERKGVFWANAEEKTGARWTTEFSHFHLSQHIHSKLQVQDNGRMMPLKSTIHRGSVSYVLAYHLEIKGQSLLPRLLFFFLLG